MTFAGDAEELRPFAASELPAALSVPASRPRGARFDMFVWVSVEAVA